MIHSHSKIWEARVEGAHWLCLRPTNYPFARVCGALSAHAGIVLGKAGQLAVLSPKLKGDRLLRPLPAPASSQRKGPLFLLTWHIQKWADQGYGCPTNQVSQEFPMTARQTELVSSGLCSVTEPQTGLGPGDRWV